MFRDRSDSQARHHVFLQVLQQLSYLATWIAQLPANLGIG